MHLIPMSLAVALTGCIDYGVGGGPGTETVAPAIEVSPTWIEFSSLEPGHQEMRDVTVTNVGDAVLRISDLERDGSTAFTLTESLPATLAPGESASVGILFSPIDPTNEGWVTVFSDDPLHPEVPVGLVGYGLVPQLTVEPEQYDFGQTLEGCVREQPIRLVSTGGAPVTISTITEVGGGFDVLDVPALPLTLDPGESSEVTVTFTAGGLGDYDGSLYIATDEAIGQRIARQTAEVIDGRFADAFVQPEVETDKTDIVLYVDQSGSMDDNERNLRDNFAAFTGVLDELQSDWQLSVVLTDDGCHRDEYIVPTTSDKDSVLEKALNIVGASEAGLTVTSAAFEQVGTGQCNEGMLRDDATTVVLLVSDEPEQSTESWDTLVGRMLAVRPGTRVSSIAGPLPSGCSGGSGDSAEAGTGYYEAAVATDGEFLSICDTDWGAKLEAVAQTADAASMAIFQLSRVPDVGTIEVSVDNVLTDEWTWSDVRNAVVFRSPDVPAPGAEIRVTYESSDCGG